GFRLDDETPLPFAEHVRVPTLMAQLHRDFLIHAERDGQAIFDALGADDKELLWIEESNQRFYAYNYFGQHPERLVGWFDQHMTTAVHSRRRKRETRRAGSITARRGRARDQAPAGRSHVDRPSRRRKVRSRS